MAASTVAYTDTTGNKDYLGIIAGQIGRRLKEASDMASDERAYAEDQAEKGGTSLSEAGIGKGYFFKRALGSRFGGDRIARTKGRLGIGGAGTNPTGDFKSRFRGGFDYNVTNELSSMPVSNALTAGLRGVESGLVAISQSLNSLASGMNDLARAQEDAARQAIMNGAFMQAFLNFMQREASRQGARREESGLERGRLSGNRGLLGGRGMINVTPGSGGRRGGGGGSTSSGLLSFATSQLLGKGTATKAGLKVASDLPAAVKAVKSGGIGALTKAATSEEVVSAAGKLITGDTIPDPLMKSIDDMIPVFGKSMPAIFAGDSLEGAVMSVEATEKMSQATAKLQKELGPEASKLLDDLMYGNFGAKAIKQEDAVKLFEYIKKGGYTGLPMSTDEVLDIMKQGMGEVQYNKLLNGAMKGADKPIMKQLGGTVAEQTLKQGSKLGLKSGAKSLVKKLPLIGAIAGIAFGIERALKGDFLGAGLEVTSGLLGMAPGLGSGIGLGIDGFLLARDMNAMPMADGGFLNKRTLVEAGEAGLEGFFPLEGARGKKTFKMFGQGVVDAREENESGETKLLALGQKRYFESMDGWSGFADAIVESFTNFRDKVGDIISDANPFNQENLANINNSKATNTIRNVIGSEKDDGFIGPKWLGIKNPFADEQANALNNNSAQMTNGGMGVTTTVINNYNGAIVGDGSGDSGSGSSSLDAYAAFTQQFSLSSK